MFNLASIQVTDDDAGNAGGGGAFSATVNGFTYRMNPLGLPSNFGVPIPTGFVEQPNFIPIGSAGTFANPSGNPPDQVYPLIDLGITNPTTGSPLTGGYYDIGMNMMFTGGTPPYEMFFQISVDPQGAGQYANGEVGYSGSMIDTGTMPYPRLNGNRSGNDLLDRLFIQIPDMTGFGPIQYSFMDLYQFNFSWLNPPVGGTPALPLPEPVNFGNPYGAQVGAKVDPFCIHFDLANLNSGVGSSPNSGNIYDVSINFMEAIDSAGSIVDIIQTQYGGSPVHFQFLLA